MTLDDRKTMKTQDAAVVTPRRGRFAEDWGWERAIVTFALSLFPGCGHLYVGLPHRAAAWSLVYLFVFLPACLAGYVLWSSTQTVYLGLAGAFGLFFLACALGPTLVALSGPRGTIARSEVRPSPPLHVLGTYAFLIHLGGCVEVAFFRHQCFTRVETRGECLAPILDDGEEVRVLVSPYVRPVHGEVILLARPRGAEPVAETVLGRVLARPHDTVAWSDGVLMVNGHIVDCGKSFPRKRLEQSGRRARRGRIFGGPPPLAEYGGIEARGAETWPRVAWADGVAGPLLLRKKEYLVLPATCNERVTLTTGAPPSEAWLVPESSVLGRAVY